MASPGTPGRQCGSPGHCFLIYINNVRSGASQNASCLRFIMRIITIKTTSLRGVSVRPKALSNLMVACVLVLAASASRAQDAEVRLTIVNHKFEPAEITVPAGRKVKLVIDNQDATAEEFESYELNREKVVPPKAQITIFIGPLQPGRYPFFGDFHKDTAQGVLIAK
jgi:plastocyanin